MKWIKRGIVAIVALIGLVFVAGLSRPAGHVALTEAVYSAAPESVWAVIADFETWGDWNPEVSSMTRLESRNGREAWLARGSWGDLPTEIVRSEPPAALETYVDGGVFFGTWLYELTPEAGGTRLRVTETGEVPNPLFRAFNLFSDEYASMRAFHSALAERLGEQVEIREVTES